MIKLIFALCLLIAVQKSDSQTRTGDVEAKDGKPKAANAKMGRVPDNVPDRGLGRLVGGDKFSDYAGPYNSENCLPVYAEYLGESSNAAGLVETAKQALIIDLKIPVSVFDIVGLNVEQKSNGYLFRIHCTKQLPVCENWLTPVGDDTWLYITLADAQADVAVLEDFKLTAFVKKINIFQSATSVQLTFLLKGQVNSVSLLPVEGSKDIFVAVFMPTEEQLALRKAR